MQHQAYPDKLGDPHHPRQTQKQDDVEGQVILKAGYGQPYDLQHRQVILQVERFFYFSSRHGMRPARMEVRLQLLARIKEKC